MGQGHSHHAHSKICLPAPPLGDDLSSVILEESYKILLPDEVNVLLIPLGREGGGAPAQVVENEPTIALGGEHHIIIKARKYGLNLSNASAPLTSKAVSDRLKVWYRVEELDQKNSALEIATSGEVGDRMSSIILQISITISTSRPLEVRTVAPQNLVSFDSEAEAAANGSWRLVPKSPKS